MSQLLMTLMQDEHWIDREGNVLQLTDMPDEYLYNVHNFLYNRRDKLHLGMVIACESMLSRVRGEQALWLLEEELSNLEETDPQLWFKELPLICRIEEILRERSTRAGGLVRKALPGGRLRRVDSETTKGLPVPPNAHDDG